jgi:2-methylcitrate dehydratase
LSTHTKFYPAEHHAQSAIEAAIAARRQIGRARITKIVIETFRVAVEIIGSEKEKWKPTTRETADHSIPYLVAVALLDGDVTLEQFKRRRFLDADVRSLLSKTVVRESKKIQPHLSGIFAELREGAPLQRAGGGARDSAFQRIRRPRHDRRRY